MELGPGAGALTQVSLGGPGGGGCGVSNARRHFKCWETLVLVVVCAGGGGEEKGAGRISPHFSFFLRTMESAILYCQAKWCGVVWRVSSF